MKVWCSNCGYEGEGELEDASYLDEYMGWVAGFQFLCPKCNFHTGSTAIEEHFAKKKVKVKN